MKNVYDGVIILYNRGEAEIEPPDWFGTLNKDFRYQLTAIVPDQICILQRKYLMVSLLQTTVKEAVVPTKTVN